MKPDMKVDTMKHPNMRNAMNQYNQTAVKAGIMSASPHRLIQMLMEGALDKIAIAKGCMERNQIEMKGKHISWAISIIGGLRTSLDKKAGGEIAQNLEDLYDYMERRLAAANAHNDPSILDEVSSLLRQIKEAWDAIGEQVSAMPPHPTTLGGP